MGRLTLVIDDRNNRIDLWDFGGNPAGIVEADTNSTLELRPMTAAQSAVHDLVLPTAGRQRQDLAARDLRTGYELLRRKPHQSAYGLVGDLGLLRMDEPYSQSVEVRSHYTRPTVMPVITGRMPLLFPDRMTYALRLQAGYQNLNQRYRAIVQNSVGEYLDQDGDVGDPPDFFTPDEYTIRTLGLGAAVSYRFGRYLTAAVGLDRVGTLIKGTNDGGRYSSRTREDRPYNVGQGTLIGRIGGLEWGADVRGWKATSDEEYVFSLSTGGQASVPLVSRGKRKDRKEEGSTLRTRARWRVGSLELGAGLNTEYRRIEIFAPEPGTESFNDFRNQLFYRVGIDTLAIPDSVMNNQFDERGWEASAGASWRLPGDRGVVGAEFHKSRLLYEQRILGEGPRRTDWDVRGGLEYVVSPVLSLRTGYIHRWEDRDEFTASNEYISNGMTLGAGFAPAGATWRVDWGYELEWVRADFGDPGSPRENRQRLAMQILWMF